jgi:hypothetical protein
MNIGIVSLVDEHYKDIAALSAPNKRQYAALHGYTFEIEYALRDITRSPPWNKILTLEHLLPKYDWLFWTDADSLIMNPGIKLESLIQGNKDIIISKDWNGINAGQFLIRNCDWSMKFLREVYGRTDFIEKDFEEQSAMGLLLTAPEHCTHVRYIPQPLINSYIESYQEGDFLVHFVGYRYNKLGLIETFAKWLPKTYDPSPNFDCRPSPILLNGFSKNGTRDQHQRVRRTRDDSARRL